jgi:hypothetical protein
LCPPWQGQCWDSGWSNAEKHPWQAIGIFAAAAALALASVVTIGGIDAPIIATIGASSAIVPTGAELASDTFFGAAAVAGTQISAGQVLVAIGFTASSIQTSLDCTSDTVSASDCYWDIGTLAIGTLLGLKGVPIPEVAKGIIGLATSGPNPFDNSQEAFGDVPTWSPISNHAECRGDGPLGSGCFGLDPK